MGQRLQLQSILEELLGTSNVYFQPPANVHMKYPCIVYKRDTGRSLFAGNKPYRFTKRYQVTYISGNPDDAVPDKIAELPMCVFDRHYAANHLNHDVFSIFF